MTHFGLHYLLPGELEPGEVHPYLQKQMKQWEEGPTGTPLRVDLTEAAPENHHLYEEIYRKVTSSGGETTGWSSFAAAHNQHFGYEEEEEGFLHYDEATDSCYSIEDYNPDARFDFYRVGGRWSQYWRLKKGALGEALGGKVWLRKEVPHVDGARLKIIDLEGMMQRAEEEAEHKQETYRQLTTGTPPIKTVEEIDKELIANGTVAPPIGNDVEQQQAAVRAVTEAYWAQPALQRIQQAILQGGAFIDPIEVIRAQREGYAARRHAARMAALPVYAHVDLDGQWHYCESSSNATPDEVEAYNEATTEYITSLDPNTWIVTLDLHI